MPSTAARIPTARESRANLLKAYRFQEPDYIPAVFFISPAAWKQYDSAALDEIIGDHSRIFGGLKPGQVDPEKIVFEPFERADVPYTDPWGCVWETSENGITGCITRHPLAGWDDFPFFRAPIRNTSPISVPLIGIKPPGTYIKCRRKDYIPGAACITATFFCGSPISGDSRTSCSI